MQELATTRRHTTERNTCCVQSAVSQRQALQEIPVANLGSTSARATVKVSACLADNSGCIPHPEIRELKATILVVEDDETTRRYVKHVIQIAGHEVLEAATGKQALAAVCSVPVDLVITDIFMPEMDGLELMTELKKSNPGLKVIAMSAALEGQVLRQVRALGVQAALRKPFGLQELLDAVAKAVTLGSPSVPGPGESSSTTPIVP
jgi:CheY-like chemotaxis protein